MGLAEALKEGVVNVGLVECDGRDSVDISRLSSDVIVPASGCES